MLPSKILGCCPSVVYIVNEEDKRADLLKCYENKLGSTELVIVGLITREH
jgi:hypothetical protein